MLFGGGEAEGTDAVVRALPGRPRLVERLPRPLSDAGAATLDGAAYVAGGWDGVTPSTAVYRHVPGRPPTVAGHLRARFATRRSRHSPESCSWRAARRRAEKTVSAIESFDPRSGRTTLVATLPYAVTDAARPWQAAST